MTAEALTKDQEKFLNECLLEFADRYTDSDLEYQKVYDDGIPAPPIVHPWYGRPKQTGNRDRFGGRNNYRSGNRDRDRYDHRDRYDNYRDNRYESNGDRYQSNYDQRRSRPY